MRVSSLLFASGRSVACAHIRIHSFASGEASLFRHAKPDAALLEKRKICGLLCGCAFLRFCSLLEEASLVRISAFILSLLEKRRFSDMRNQMRRFLRSERSVVYSADARFFAFVRFWKKRRLCAYPHSFFRFWRSVAFQTCETRCGAS